MKNRAFTLIELLVVVLIISILVAIAVPKYQVAVDKAEFKKYETMARSLGIAYDEYYLATGKTTKNFSDLTIALPSDFTKAPATDVEFNCVTNSQMYCCMSYSGLSAGGYIFCGKKDLSIVYGQKYFGRNYSDIERRGYCYAKVGDTRSNKACASLGQDLDKTSRVWTTEGYNNSYHVYAL